MTFFVKLLQIASVVLDYNQLYSKIKSRIANFSIFWCYTTAQRVSYVALATTYLCEAGFST